MLPDPPDFGTQTPDRKIFRGVRERGSAHGVLLGQAWISTLQFFDKAKTVEVFWVRVSRPVVHELPSGYADGLAYRDPTACAAENKWLDGFTTDGH